MFRRTRRPLDQLQVERIAIIKPSALGDIVHALPVLSAVRTRFPQAHISWVVNRAYEPLLHGHPDLDATVPFDRGALKRGLLPAFSTVSNFRRTLSQQRFDLVFDLQGLLRSALMTWATGAPRRVGLSSSREGAAWFYTDLLPDSTADSRHAVDRYWTLATALGVGHLPRQFVLPRSDRAEAWARDLLAGWPRPWVAVAPGARWQTKRWLPAHFRNLTRQLQERFGGTLLFVGGAEERSTADEVSAGLHGPRLNLAGETTIPQLIALLRQVDLMIGNDTGPLHLAVGLGRPVVAPYTCTRIDMTGPYAAETGAVATRVDCSGSLKKTCSHMKCMSELLPERLWPVVEEILQRWRVQRPSA